MDDATAVKPKVLLDHNLPKQVKPLLEKHGWPCTTTYEHGWQELENGDLAAVAFKAGIKIILTNDKNFANSAAHALALYTHLTVVFVQIPQMHRSEYVITFEQHLISTPLPYEVGKLLYWP